MANGCCIAAGLELTFDAVRLERSRSRTWLANGRLALSWLRRRSGGGRRWCRRLCRCRAVCCGRRRLWMLLRLLRSLPIGLPWRLLPLRLLLLPRLLLPMLLRVNEVAAPAVAAAAVLPCHRCRQCASLLPLVRRPLPAARRVCLAVGLRGSCGRRRI